MSEFKIRFDDKDYIAHYGIPGMKRGKRRWTNADGTLNEAGKLRYRDGPVKGTEVKTSTIINKDGSMTTKYIDQRGREVGQSSSSSSYQKTSGEKIQELDDLRKTQTAKKEFSKSLVDKVKTNVGSSVGKSTTSVGGSIKGLKSTRTELTLSEKASKKAREFSNSAKSAYKAAKTTAGNAYDKGKTFVNSLLNRRKK